MSDTIPFELEDEIQLAIIDRDDTYVHALSGMGVFVHNCRLYERYIAVYSRSKDTPSGFCKVRKLRDYYNLYWLVEQL